MRAAQLFEVSTCFVKGGPRAIGAPTFTPRWKGGRVV
jgi:hypothetical protein